MATTKRISSEVLARLPRCEPETLTPARAWECVCQLGEVLARWVAHPVLLQQAAAYLEQTGDHTGAAVLCQRPQLPQASGSCWVVFITSPGKYPCLRPACVLPLRWHQGASHSSALPPSLRQLADQVLETLRAEASADSPYREPWGLHLASETGLDDYDFSQLLDVTCNSGFASLAAGLVVAVEGGTPRPAVWASAGWNDDFGPDRVEGLAAKLQLATEWGASDFFVAGSQVDEAQAAVAQRHLALNIHGLGAPQPTSPRAGKADPVKSALASYLQQLETPPAADATPAQRTAYYLRLRPSEPNLARRYYRDCMLADIAARCRALLPADFKSPAVLVTVLSHSPELVSLAASVVRPTLCIVLYTPDLKTKLTPEIHWLQDSFSVEIDPMLIDADQRTWLDHLPARLRGRLEEVPPGPVYFDLTPGSKLLTVGLTLAARPGDKRLYLSHDFDRGPIPWTEQPLLWDVPTTLPTVPPQVARSSRDL